MQWAELTKEAIFNTFEKMFYTFLEPSDVHYLGFDVASNVDFKGAMTGTVTLQLSHGMAKHMVSHLLNLPPDKVADEQVEDCVKEAANMICGCFLSSADRQNAYQYLPPRFFTTPDGPWPASPTEGGTESIRLDFDSENGRVSVILALSQ